MFHRRVGNRAGTEKWRAFWSGRDDPLHRKAPEFERRHSAELNALLPPDAASVLEYACGNGDLFELLGFNSKDYVGVDFSPQMIETFRQRFPQSDVSCADAQQFRRTKKFDLIFSNGFIQYLDTESLTRLMANSAEMLAEGGVIIHASVPSARSRWAYTLGDESLFPGGKSTSVRLRSLVSEVTGRSAMGKWWSASELGALGAAHRLTAEYYGSLVYPYRVHVIFRQAPDVP